MQIPPLDKTRPWSPSETHCLNVTTPILGTEYTPNDRVLIKWHLFSKCVNLTNLVRNFTLSLHNDPEVSGFVKPSYKSLYDELIASNVNSLQYLWTVPFIRSDKVQNMSLFYIHVVTSSFVEYENHAIKPFGVTGPFGIEEVAAKFPKTWYMPQNTHTITEYQTSSTTPTSAETESEPSAKTLIKQ
ncbi:3731_t:CDS:1, partial [Ambispora gerdemannii]